MNFLEATVALNKGYKICNPKCAYKYLMLKDKIGFIVNQDCFVPNLTPNELLSNEWSIWMGFVKFSELAIGHRFQYNGEEYLKVYAVDAPYNAIKISSNEVNGSGTFVVMDLKNEVKYY